MRGANSPLMLLIAWLLYSCVFEKEEKKVYEYLLSGRWDSVRNHIDHSNQELDFILMQPDRMTLKYEFHLIENRLVLKAENLVADTIQYSWNGLSKELALDSMGVMYLFSNEIVIRSKMVLHYIEVKKAHNAWQWLTYPKPLQIDSLYGELFHELYYDLGMDQYSEAIPHIRKAWESGHAASGLALSFWLGASGRREEAISILKTLADARNTEAMIELGEIYDTYSKELGYKPPSDARPESQFRWYKRAADLSNSLAMYHLGFIYERGINRRIKADSAFYWYRRASKLGESSASSAMGVCFLDGKLVKKSLDSGMYWMNKSIQQDRIHGYMEMGKVFERGVGVILSEEQALKYYQLADSAGSKVAKFAIERIIRRQGQRVN